MSINFWIIFMFILWFITTHIACFNIQENKILRRERSKLLNENCDLRDEIHHLKVKYGEIPVTSWIMTDTTIQKVGGSNE